MLVPVVIFLLRAKITTPTTKTVNSCASFSTDAGEVSCEEAKQIALKSYVGQVQMIEKITIDFRRRTASTQKRRVWVFHIKPNDPQILNKDAKGNATQVVESVGVNVDRNTKEVLFAQLAFKK